MRAIGALVGALLIIAQAGSTVRRIPRSETNILEPGGLRKQLRGSIEGATRLYSAGRFDQAVLEFTEVREKARRAHLPDLTARAIWGLGNCHLLQSRYDEALRAFSEAEGVFARLGDVESASTMQGSIASLYSQLGETDAALATLRRSLDKPGERLEKYRPGALVLLAELLARQGQLEDALPIFYEGIDAAWQIGYMHQVAFGWNRMGQAYLSRGQLAEAEHAFLEEFRIRKLFRTLWVEGTQTALGILRIEQGDLTSASALLESVSLPSSSATGLPYWRYYRARARLRQAQGRVSDALEDYRLAMDLARTHRALLPAGDALRISFEGTMQDLFSSFLEVGAEHYFSHPSVGLLRELFEAAEENRAASLDARIREDPRWRKNLPPQFGPLTRELKQAEAVLVRENGPEARHKVSTLRDELLRMEAAAGSDLSESNRVRARTDLLRRTQTSLAADSTLFSFHSGERVSHLFAVTVKGLALYRLPPRSEIRRLAQRFSLSVGGGGPSSTEGDELYAALFKGVEKRYRANPGWLLSLDDRLFDVPFAALPVPEGGFLVEHKRIELVPNAQMVASPGAAAGPVPTAFVGVGDPVYNTADERWTRSRGPFAFLRRLPLQNKSGLARLPGSAREIDASAQVWPTASVLSGMEARVDNVRRAAETGPGVLHFATHVVRGPSPRDEVRIALSLSGEDEPGYLTETEIRGYRANAGLVVLSACGSGSARSLPGTGLLGLTRAWLMAGAGSVLASHWAVPDDSGEFFVRFYRGLRARTRLVPAEALRRAQMDTIASGGWRSAPRYWASYFVVGRGGR